MSANILLLAYIFGFLIVNIIVKNFTVIVIFESVYIYIYYYFNKVNLLNLGLLSFFLDIIHLNTPGSRIFSLLCGVVSVEKLCVPLSNNILNVSLKLAVFTVACYICLRFL
jgi:hypothetical protein